MTLRIGPVTYRIGSDWASPIEALRCLYAAYPAAFSVPDFTVRLEATRFWRRYIRPSVLIGGDFTLPEAAPLPLSLGLLAAEMGMNLQLALGERRFLLLHASAVERDGRALIMTGESGSGKSTLATLLGECGWRFLGDEFVLVEPGSGLVYPFPRPSSLKNASIAILADSVPECRFGPLLTDTPKGNIRHIMPPDAALAAMDVPAYPAALVFPRFGLEPGVRPVAPSETFVRLTQASTNYVAMGERGFETLTRLVEGVPAIALDYPDTSTALRQINELWCAL